MMNIRDDRPVENNYVGRVSELEEVHKHLFQSKNPVMVVGVRGIGKTSFVKSYENRFHNEYSKTAYISAEALIGESAFYHLLARNLSLRTSEPSAIARALQADRTLIIVDDLSEIHPAATDAIGYQIRRMSMEGQQSHFLVTSSNLQTSRVLSVDSPLFNHFLLFHLSGLTKQDFDSILNNFGIKAPPEAIAEIHSRTNGHPLALHLLANLLRGGEYDVSAVLRNLNESFDTQWGSALTNILIFRTPEGFKAVPVARDRNSGIFTPTNEVFISSPYVHIKAHSHFWREKLSEFDDILNDPSAREHHFQEFFERNPQFLLGLDYERAIPHPILYREEDGPLIPDFFLQPLDNALCDVLDLKLPTAKLIVGGKNRLRLSSSLFEAVAQLREYHDYFEDPNLREAVRNRYGITAFKPALSVVIGRSPRHISPEKYRQIQTGAGGVQLLTYDDLRRKMERMISKMSF